MPASIPITGITAPSTPGVPPRRIRPYTPQTSPAASGDGADAPPGPSTIPFRNEQISSAHSNTTSEEPMHPDAMVRTECRIPERDRDPKYTAQPEDYTRKDRLMRYVKSRGWFVSRDRRNWLDAFGKLRREHSPDEIDATLAFVIDNKLDKPRIRNGEELRQCWNWLQDLREKSARDNPPPVVVTPAAERVARRMRANAVLPPAVDAELPQTVQRSLDAVGAFLDGLRAAAGRGDRAARRLTDAGGVLGNAADVVYDWLTWRLEGLKKREYWDGRLPSWSPSADWASGIVRDARGVDWNTLVGKAK